MPRQFLGEEREMSASAIAHATEPSATGESRLRLVRDPAFGPDTPPAVNEWPAADPDPRSDAEDCLVDDETLLTHGFPRSEAGCGLLLDLADEHADVHTAAVIGIELERLRLAIRQLEPHQTRILKLALGIGCERLTPEEVAEHSGLTTAVVESPLLTAHAELLRRFSGARSAVRRPGGTC